MNLMDYTLENIETLMLELKEPKYRAKQVYAWLMKGVAPKDMTNLSTSLREKLAQIPFGGAKIHSKWVSQKDGTVKYLFELEDQNLVEGVLMHYHHGNTLCLSTQVGCAMGCLFCASTLEGCVRDLTAGEMIAQVAEAERDTGIDEGRKRGITNIVLMGSGEPLLNYDNVVMFLKRITSPDGMNISPRNISLSTCGLVPELLKFIDDAPHVTLSVSLHAPNDEIRSKIMPVNKRYPMDELLNAAKTYSNKTGRRVIFEYALIKDLNDSQEHAKELAKKLRGMRAHVNLIPLNPVEERNLEGVTRAHANQFMQWLDEQHISATVRREMGQDIKSACGQLRRRVLGAAT